MTSRAALDPVVLFAQIVINHKSPTNLIYLILNHWAEMTKWKLIHFEFEAVPQVKALLPDLRLETIANAMRPTQGLAKL